MRLGIPKVRRGWRSVAASLLCLALAVGAWSINGGRDAVVPAGTPIGHDDWTFNVRSARRRAAVGPAPATITVRLEVANRARRVGYAFSRGSATLVDGRAHVYRPTGGPDGPCGATLPAGAACVDDLVYEVPDDARGLRLRIEAGGIGDALERMIFGWKWIDLEPGRQQ